MATILLKLLLPKFEVGFGAFEYTLEYARVACLAHRARLVVDVVFVSRKIKAPQTRGAMWQVRRTGQWAWTLSPRHASGSRRQTHSHIRFQVKFAVLASPNSHTFASLFAAELEKFTRSGEAELLAATSTLCDALFVRRQLLSFIADVDPPQVHRFLDARAAKAIMQRRWPRATPECTSRVLWSQQLVAEQVIALHKVGTSVNVADLNTKGVSRGRMLTQLNLLGCWHTLRECFVGEDEIAELHYRVSSTCTVSKPMVQAIVVAVICALGRATGNPDGEDGLIDQGDDLPDWAKRVLVWFLGLWVRDDTDVSIVDMLMQPS
ncbi:unnamed protein product, partial [Symbiodinium sp. CCMP2592]